MKRSKFSTLFALHLMLMLYSMSEICSKKAAGESFLSVRFCLYYGTVILLPLDGSRSSSAFRSPRPLPTRR